MAMEYPEYRDVLEQLNLVFGPKNWISTAEVAEYDGCCVRTIKKRYGIRKGVGGIDKAVLARKKCELAH